ncbi:hypothetical protein ON058_07620 [Demequina sp. B12]|nr:hypothetical protein [Demequina sp. B12]MDE0573280.1 hypothetical protein [Demequina sp. B12]
MSDGHSPKRRPAAHTLRPAPALAHASHDAFAHLTGAHTSIGLLA